MGMNVGAALPSGERWVMSRLSQLVGQRPVVVDAGANQGHWSVALLAAVPEARLFAFEPSPTACGRLERALDGRAEAVNAAVGSERGEMSLFTPEPGSEHASLYQRQIPGEILDQTEKVAVRRLDEFFRSRSIERVDVLKLDVEGHELEALRGCGSLLDDISVIQFEFGGAAIDAKLFFRDLYGFLAEHGFRLFRLLPEGLWPIGDYDESREIFVFSNYLALNSTVAVPQ
jgi:FkbM family methyltransferase